MTAVLATACGGGAPAANSRGLEEPHLVVGTLPVPDAAPLFIAIQKGLFKKEGLSVRTRIIKAGPDAIPELINGHMGITLTNYVSTILAQANGNGAVHMRFLSDSYQSGNGAFVVMAPPGSPIKKPSDLAGKTIAVPALRAIGTLVTSVALSAYGVKPDALKFVELAFPDMPGALQKKRVDAAWLAEPFALGAAKLGAQQVLDTGAAGTSGDKFPVSGWGALDRWVSANPKTTAAFQRAMSAAQRMAASDRGLVSQTLPTYIKGLDLDTARVITLGTYPTSLSAKRLQEVADLMLNYHYLNKPVDVGPMVVPQPKRAA